MYVRIMRAVTFLFYQERSYPLIAARTIINTIISVEKKNTGIKVTWKEPQKEKEKSDLLSFSQLAELRIVVIDLLEHPALCRIDIPEYRIYRSAKSGGSF